jgi:hypothetical protein
MMVTESVQELFRFPAWIIQAVPALKSPFQHWDASDQQVLYHEKSKNVPPQFPEFLELLL